MKPSAAGHDFIYPIYDGSTLDSIHFQMQCMGRI